MYAFTSEEHTNTFLCDPCVTCSYCAGGAHSIALEFAELYGSRDPSGDSREKTILYIDLLVAVDRLSDAVAVTRISKHTEHDVEMFNCFLDKCQQGVYI